MPKYYVNAKPIYSEIIADSPKLALKKILIKNHGKGIMVGPIAEVSESGFFDDFLFYTDEILREIYDEKSK